MANGWKITAIIFIVLFLLETALLIWAMNYGTEIINNEQECMWNTCEDYLTYAYDKANEMCYCYEDHEIVKEVFMG